LALEGREDGVPGGETSSGSTMTVRRGAPGRSGQRPSAKRAFGWVQFWYAFVFFGAVAFLHVDPPLDTLGVHLAKTLVIALLCAYLAGRFGDRAWEWIVRVLRESV
jgi:hypothetical protein